MYKMSNSYATKVLRITDSIMSSDEPPYVKSVAERASLLTCMPFLCAPCCLWSTCWRCVACPFMCACKGVGFVCSNNGCTNITDAVIGDYYNKANEREFLPYFKPGDYTSELLDAITVVESHFQGVASYTNRHRALTANVILPMCCPEHCINPGSANALNLLVMFRHQLVDCI